MTWVKTDPEFDSNANILASHSLNSGALKSHITMYRTIMFGDSPLTRAEREAMAVTVSAANDCHY